MFLWYVGVSVLGVYNIFRSVGIDFRLVAIGSLLPLLVDLPFGHMAIGHTLLTSVVLLVAVMLGTIGRPRLVRRRLLCIPIGTFAGLVLSGAWMHTQVMWWPTAGSSFGDALLVPRTWALVVEEIVGLVACWWAVGMFSLYESGPRRAFWQTGRLHASDRET